MAQPPDEVGEDPRPVDEGSDEAQPSGDALKDEEPGPEDDARNQRPRKAPPSSATRARKISEIEHPPRFSADTGMFQLDMEQPDVKSHLPLYRLDWRPFRNHLNGPDGPEELRGLLIKEGATHEHTCLFHADDKGEFIRPGGRLPTAKILTPDPGSFHEALTYVCATLSIVNQDDIPPASAQGRMV